MWDSRAYRHSVRPIPLLLLATIVLGSIGFSAVEKTPANVKKLAGTEAVQMSWQQRMNAHCTDQTNSLLNEVKKTGRGWESYKEMSDNCRLLYFQANPVAQSEDPEQFDKLRAEFAAKDARARQLREERRARCVDDVNNGFNAAAAGEPRTFISDGFSLGYDVGTVAPLVKQPELEKRLENARIKCERAR